VGMTTSGAGGLKPSEACGRTVLYNSTPERPQDHGTDAVVSVASLERSLGLCP
jgi:hypothetical protein